MSYYKNSVSPQVKLDAEKQNLKLLLAYAIEISISGSYSQIVAIKKSIQLCKGRILHLKQIMGQ